VKPLNLNRIRFEFSLKNFPGKQKYKLPTSAMSIGIEDESATFFYLKKPKLEQELTISSTNLQKIVKLNKVIE